MSWGGIKKGDAVIITRPDGERLTRGTVASAGNMWITTDRGDRFRSDNGVSDGGEQMHTEATLAAAQAYR